jgi:hypothetical protein
MMQESSGYCGQCQKQVMIRRPTANHTVHLLLSLISMGLWLPIWVLSAVQFGGWRCTACGKPCSRTFESKDWALLGVAVVGGFLGFTSMGQSMLGGCEQPAAERRVAAKPKPPEPPPKRDQPGDVVQRIRKDARAKRMGVDGCRYDRERNCLVVELGGAWWGLERGDQDAFAKSLADGFLKVEQGGAVEFLDEPTGMCVGRFDRSGGGMK